MRCLTGTMPNMNGRTFAMRQKIEKGDFDFCPVCGRPITDEAVDMVMERMDELQNEIG